MIVIKTVSAKAVSVLGGVLVTPSVALVTMFGGYLHYGYLHYGIILSGLEFRSLSPGSSLFIKSYPFDIKQRRWVHPAMDSLYHELNPAESLLSRADYVITLDNDS